MNGDIETNITTREHVRSLQEILVQACIDYINRHGLTDVWAVSFRADALSESAKSGGWQPATDSYIKLEGVRRETVTGNGGEPVQVMSPYTIGEYM